MTEQPPLSAYRALRIPVLIMKGERSPRPSRLIADTLYRALPNARLVEIGGAGHMGPATHAETVETLIVEHIRRARAGRLPPHAEAVTRRRRTAP